MMRRFTVTRRFAGAALLTLVAAGGGTSQPTAPNRVTALVALRWSAR
jgi:hypothetical protein